MCSTPGSLSVAVRVELPVALCQKPAIDLFQLILEAETRFSSNFADVLAGKTVPIPRQGHIVIGQSLSLRMKGKDVRAGRLNNQMVIIKVLNVNNGGIHEDSSEIVLFERIESLRWTCTEVVKYLDSFSIGTDCRCLVFEMLGPPLLERMGIAYHVDVVKTYGHQLFRALGFLHSCGIAHCDITPSNICTAANDVYKIKLVDFGSAMTTQSLQQHVGHNDLCEVPYRPPEVLFGLPYTSKLDIWSAGVMLVELYCGRCLFPTNCPKRLARFQYSLKIVPTNVERGGAFNMLYKQDQRTGLHRPWNNVELLDRKLDISLDEMEMTLNSLKDLRKFGFHGNRNPNPRSNDQRDTNFLNAIELILQADADKRPKAFDILYLDFFWVAES